MNRDPLEARKRQAEIERRITVGELRQHLDSFNDSDWVIFSETEAGNYQVFYRTKSRGDELCQIELREVTDEWLRYYDGAAE